MNSTKNMRPAILLRNIFINTRSAPRLFPLSEIHNFNYKSNRFTRLSSPLKVTQLSSCKKLVQFLSIRGKIEIKDFSKSKIRRNYKQSSISGSTDSTSNRVIEVFTLFRVLLVLLSVLDHFFELTALSISTAMCCLSAR